MKKQIILGFSIIFLVFGLGSAVIIHNLLRSTNSLQYLLSLHKIEDMRQNLNLRVQKVQAYVHLSALDFSYNLDDIISNIQELETSAKECLTCHHEPEIEKEITYTHELIHNYEEKLSYLITSANDDTWRSDNQKQAVKLSDSIIHHVQDMVNRAAATLQRKTDLAMREIRKTYLFLSITMITTVLMTLFIARTLTKRITTPIDTLLLATKKLATGELGYTTELHGNDEFGQLQTSFNEMSIALAKKDAENKVLASDLQNKIDELHTTQHQLILSEKLASLGKLAGGISHDFNNILCGMLGYISILKQQLKEKEGVTDNLNTLEKATLRAAHLVKRLESYAGQRESVKRPVNINTLVQEVQQTLLATIGHNHAITLTLADGLALVNGDAASLKEVLCNICENSIEAFAANSKGVITITTQNETNQEQQEEGSSMVRISIRDNGVGIGEANLQMIFDPYFSTRERSSRRGMGLGMAIAFSIVNSHQGRITIDSHEGLGTQVDIVLPALPPEVLPQQFNS